jgi:hypothetical protein
MINTMLDLFVMLDANFQSGILRSKFLKVVSLPDTEIPEFARVLFFPGYNVFNPCGGRSDMAPTKHFIHACLFTFEQGFHTAVGNIPYPALKVERSCRPLRFRTEKHSLYSTADINMKTLHNSIC